MQAGTGSGKTEAFLLPLLADILDESEEVRREPGVRAILVYPLNALVNNQVERLEQWLDREGLGVTVAHYTSQLDETYREAVGAGKRSAPCKLISREQVRGACADPSAPVGPPHILVTNYSMLEYMLIRPDDIPVFKGGKLGTIVLDEAHTYTGTMAAEIALLLHRVRERFGKPAQEVSHIATSATLGSEGSKEALHDYACRIFGLPASCVRVITGQRKQPEIPTEMVENIGPPSDRRPGLAPRGTTSAGRRLGTGDRDRGGASAGSRSRPGRRETRAVVGGGRGEPEQAVRPGAPGVAGRLAARRPAVPGRGCGSA